MTRYEIIYLCAGVLVGTGVTHYWWCWHVLKLIQQRTRVE